MQIIMLLNDTERMEEWVMISRYSWTIGVDAEELDRDTTT